MKIEKENYFRIKNCVDYGISKHISADFIIIKEFNLKLKKYRRLEQSHVGLERNFQFQT